jgi:hypothetical protein
MRTEHLAAMGLAGLLLAGCGGGIDDGLVKHPVTGVVRVDGQPEAGVRVRLFRQGTAGDSNADTPVGVTDDQGRFALSTNGERDGAVEGTYKVTFFWPDSNGPGGKNQLDGEAGNPRTTPYAVSVAPGPNVLPDYDPRRKADAGAPAAGPRARDADGRRAAR